MLVTSRWNQWFPKLPLKSTGETTYVPFPQTGTNIFILHGLVSRTLSSHAYSSLQDALPDSLSISDPSLASPLLLEGEDLCHLPSQLQPGNAFTPQPLIFFNILWAFYFTFCGSLFRWGPSIYFHPHLCLEHPISYRNNLQIGCGYSYGAPGLFGGGGREDAGKNNLKESFSRSSTSTRARQISTSSLPRRRFTPFHSRRFPTWQNMVCFLPIRILLWWVKTSGTPKEGTIQNASFQKELLDSKARRTLAGIIKGTEPCFF